ncbi:cytochrome C [bacterium]|nr:cytochrome C [bacterium]
MDSPHNLSVSGPGPIKSSTEKQICIFCHTPHNADPRAPLWNRDLDSATTYITYSSPTFQPGTAPQPDGASKLCLSCHDGTIALGQVRSRPSPIPVVGGPTLKPGDEGYLGTDLSGSHPISFVYDDALAIENNAAGDMPLRLPSTLHDPDVKLDKDGKIQCITCHDPHDDSNHSSGNVPHFYVKPDWSAVCTTCHDF